MGARAGTQAGQAVEKGGSVGRGARAAAEEAGVAAPATAAVTAAATGATVAGSGEAEAPRGWETRRLRR